MNSCIDLYSVDLTENSLQFFTEVPRSNFFEKWAYSFNLELNQLVKASRFLEDP